MKRKIISSTLSILMLLILVSCHADAGQRAFYKNNNSIENEKVHF